ncbi:MAG: translation initiation factor IF-2 subunit gamma [Candidatus Micrarchaeota archaeon]
MLVVGDELGQAEVNIGMLGHVDHGKTSITKNLTGVWTDTHSEELKRGITIRIGYADAVFRKCQNCPEPQCYTTGDKCEKCEGKPEILRKVSFLDAPGHETLMTTAIAASSIMDGALLVIAANEDCPQLQTLEHLMVLDILGIKHIVIAQNKVDLVEREKALAHYKQIQAFVHGSVAERAPIVPVVANYNVNTDALIQQIQATIPTPRRDLDSPPLMYIARSFDVNKPGTTIKKLVGGVVGGSVIRGKLRVGDEVEIRPGLKKEEKGKETYEPIIADVDALIAGHEHLQEAVPGGLIAIGTRLDPALTKADGLVGNLLGKPGTLPPTSSEFTIDFHALKRVDIENPPLKIGEPMVLNIGTSTAIAFIEKMKKSALALKLKRPICAEKTAKIAVSRKIGQRWRLSGYATMKE